VVCKQLEHVIVGYLRQVWGKSDWLNEGQHGFRTEYSCELQVITVCQDVTYCLDEGVGIDVIITDVPNTFEIVPNYRLLTKLAALGVDLRVVVWVRELFVGACERRLNPPVQRADSISSHMHNCLAIEMRVVSFYCLRTVLSEYNS
jgi:hypothetical protein